jgi:hypothetical protein
MSETIERDPRTGIGGNHPPVEFVMPTLAEQLEPEIYREQLLLDYKPWIDQCEAQRLNFVRMVLKYSTLPRHDAAALPATARQYDLIIAVFPDLSSVRQWSGSAWTALSGADFTARVVPTVVIPDEDTNGRMISYVNQTKKIRKSVEVDRKREYSVLDDACKIVQQVLKVGVLDVLDAIAGTLEKGPMSAYNNAKIARETALREAEANRLAEEANKALAIAARTQNPDLMETAVAAGVAADKAAERAAAPVADKGRSRGSQGGVSASITTWHWRIVNKELIEKRFWKLDEAALAAEAKRVKDTAEVPGIEIYSTVSASVRG